MNNRTQAKLMYLERVKKFSPALYKAATMKVARAGGLSGLGATVEEMLAEQNAFAEPAKAAWYDNILTSAVDAVKQLAPAYVGYKQQSQCLQINAERAKQGLPPVDCASAGLTPQVNVGVSPDTKIFVWAALGLGAVFLLLKRK